MGRRVLCNSFSKRAEALGLLKRYPDAVKDWDRAAEFDDDKQVSLRSNRAVALARAGEHRRATAEADLLAAPAIAPKEVVYCAACIYALPAAAVPANAQQAERYAGRAVELLRKASQRGYREVAHMKQNADLDSLRQRADLKKLLAELEK